MDLQVALEIFLKKEYTEVKVSSMIDDEITSGNWLDTDWEDDFENEFDVYEETGRGEAESAVIEQITQHACSSMGFTKEKYSECQSEEMHDTIIKMFPLLDK